MEHKLPEHLALPRVHRTAEWNLEARKTNLKKTLTRYEMIIKKNNPVTPTQFDILMEAAKALDEQGVRSCVFHRVGLTPGSRCKYRGPNGTKSFLGHLISDEDYKREMEEECCYDLMRRRENVLTGFEMRNYTVLDTLQNYQSVTGSWEKDRETNPNAMQDYVKKIVEVV